MISEDNGGGVGPVSASPHIRDNGSSHGIVGLMTVARCCFSLINAGGPPGVVFEMVHSFNQIINHSDPGAESRIRLVWPVSHMFISVYIPRLLAVVVVSVIKKLSATVGQLLLVVGLPPCPPAGKRMFPSPSSVVLLSSPVLPPLIVCLANSGH